MNQIINGNFASSEHRNHNWEIFQYFDFIGETLTDYYPLATLYLREEGYSVGVTRKDNRVLLGINKISPEADFYNEYYPPNETSKGSIGVLVKNILNNLTRPRVDIIASTNRYFIYNEPGKILVRQKTESQHYLIMDTTLNDEERLEDHTDEDMSLLREVVKKLQEFKVNNNLPDDFSSDVNIVLAMQK